MIKFMYTLALCLMSVITLSGQLRVVELQYNPPEMGNDTLEYIEFFNAGQNPIHLLNYKFTHGIVFTFPDTILNPNQYLVLSIRAASFQEVFGRSSIQWTSGALSNGGERIGVADSLNNMVVDFTYSNLTPWPTSADGTNGEGRSIELCGPNADATNGANWKVSENNLNKMVNGKALYGTPGQANSVAPCTVTPDVIVEISSNQFTPKDITIDVGQIVQWTNTGGTHNVNGSLTAFPANPEGFSSGSPMGGNWTFNHKFTKAGKYNYRCDPHASFGMVGTVTVEEEIVTNPYPARTIVSLKGVNSMGVADSLNLKCAVKGTVYGINLRPSGLQFTIMDDQGKGIGVFNNSNSLGYIVKEGDFIEVKGTVGQFRGFTQMVADEILFFGSNQPLVPAKEVQTFEEVDESSLLVIRTVSFVDKSQWGNGTAAGFNVDMTKNQTIYSVRIDGDVDLFSLPVPDGNLFDVYGLLSQFAPTSQPPFVGGYQLLPRYMSDITTGSSTFDENLVEIHVYPNPSQDYIYVPEAAGVEKVTIFDVTGKSVLMTTSNERINIQHLIPGSYKIVLTGSGMSRTGSFIKF